MEQFKNISPAVCKVITASGSGSCFYLQSNKIWVTNYHVVEGSKQVTLENFQMDRHLANVIFVNPEDDIAFLKSDYNVDGSIGIPVDSKREARMQEQLFVLGYPYGMPFSVTEGIVSSPKQLMGGKHYIQTDAAVNPGNSGGPVVASDGTLVGITTAKFQDADNMGFAIPANLMLNQLNYLSQNPENKYALKCPSCESLIITQTEWCDKCGTQLDKNIFVETPLSDFAKFVEDAISSLGINPVLARAGYEYWNFHQGSSQIRIFIYNNNYLYATSPLNNLPKANLDKLYEYLIKDSITPYKLGIYNNQIFIAFRAHLSDIYSSFVDDIKKNLTNLAIKADEMDDFFVKQYGCEMTVFSKVDQKI